MRNTLLSKPLNWLLLPKPLNWIATIGLLFSLTGCLGINTNTEILPEWVISPPRDNTHLYGVGSSARIDNLALAFIQAEQNGNAQIAQQLRTQVSQINTQDTQVSSGQGREQIAKIQTAYTRVTTAPIELEQASNEERFAGKDYVYALQSMDRSRIIAKLTYALNDLDDIIRKEAKALSTTANESPAEKDWQHYMQLIPYFAQRKSYEEDLNLYSVQHTLVGKPDNDIRAIERQLANALSSYGFDASSTTQANQLASALSKYGLTPKSHSLFTLRSITAQHHETQSSRFYVFEDGTLELIGPSGSRLASWTVSARGIAKNKKNAEEKAAENWANQAVEAMFSWLTRLN